MSANRTSTDQNTAPADATEEVPTDQDDQGIIVTAQPPRSEDDADADCADDAEQTTNRRGVAQDQGPLPASTPEDRTTAR